MKKIIIFLCLFFVCFSVSVVDASGTSDLIDYYSNLDSNISENVVGTCTYVSTNMLLSYYDTYLNDNIIPEQYDVTSSNLNVSPGVMHENLAYYASDIPLYKQKLLELSGVSLQAKLYELAVNNGITSLSISMDDRIAILTDYFLNVCKFWRSNFDFSTFIGGDQNNQTQIKNYIRNEIDYGYLQAKNVNSSTVVYFYGESKYNVRLKVYFSVTILP